VSKTVDLRSDTVTQPTTGMRQAMVTAEVGDDVFEEDPTTNALQARVAKLFGREAALFVPSGTMANQIAIRLHTHPGDEVIVGRWAHSYLYEAGAAAALSGVQINPVGTQGIYSLEEATQALKGPDIHHAPTTLFMFENTHNRSGGRVFPLADLQALSTFARANRIKTHMDGARIFNACVASGIEPKIYAGLVDTLSFCLSKGLGAPVGSMLVGDTAAIQTARRQRKMFGGGMRQVGILAAAGLYAIDQHRERLLKDHEHCQRFAQGVRSLRGISLERDPETNILMFDVDHPHYDAPALCKALEAQDVHMFAMTQHRIRAVFHLDISGAQVDYAVRAVTGLLEPPASVVRS